MVKRILFGCYIALSFSLFCLIFVAWVTGTFGDMFANIPEAMQNMLKLAIVALPPIILQRYKKSHSTKMWAITFILLLAEGVYLTYLVFWQLATLNLATISIGLLMLLVLYHMFMVFKNRP